MPHEHGVGDVAGDLREHRVERERVAVRVEEAHGVARVEERSADREEAQRREVLVRHAAPDRLVRDVEEEDAHGRTPRAEGRRAGRLRAEGSRGAADRSRGVGERLSRAALVAYTAGRSDRHA